MDGVPWQSSAAPSAHAIVAASLMSLLVVSVVVAATMAERKHSWPWPWGGFLEATRARVGHHHRDQVNLP